MAWSPRGQSFRPIFEGSECWSSGVDFVSSFGCLLGMPIQHLTPFVLPWRMLNIASDHCWSLLPFGCLSFMWTGNEHMSLEISLAMFGRIFIAALAYIYIQVSFSASITKSPRSSLLAFAQSPLAFSLHRWGQLGCKSLQKGDSGVEAEGVLLQKSGPPLGIAMAHAAKELKTLKDCGSGQCQAEPSAFRPQWLGNAAPLYIWVNYNDLTTTSLESWLVRGIIPKWPYFRLVKYYNLPR